jgi:hypothetical protein
VQRKRGKEKLESQIKELEKQFSEMRRHNENLRVENKKMEGDLANVRTQLEAIEQGKARLERIKTELENKIETSAPSKLEIPNSPDYAFLVDFGVGWGIYIMIEGEPHILRQGERVSPKRGLPLEHLDRVVGPRGKGWTITYGNSSFPWI